MMVYAPLENLTFNFEKKEISESIMYPTIQIRLSKTKVSQLMIYYQLVGNGRFVCFTLPENHVFSSNSAFELHFQEKDEKFLLFVKSTINFWGHVFLAVLMALQVAEEKNSLIN